MVLMKRIRGSSLSASDIISDLPDNVIDNILTHLPIKDAVKTSILSKTWRFKWLDLSQLVFDETFIKTSPGTPFFSCSEIALMVYQVLLLHRGSINKFALSIPELRSCFQINHIINFVSAKNVQDITLCLSNSEHRDFYLLPSALFTCTQLRHLNLSYCIFESPYAFEGLSNLISLELNHVFIINANSFSNFISKCPELRRLKVDNAFDIGHLEIDAPNLKFLCFSGTFIPISFKNAPLLTILSIRSFHDWNAKYSKWKNRNSNAVEFLCCLPAIRRLVAGRSIVKLLSVDNIPLRLPTSLSHLKYLELPEICFNSIDDVRFALCLIKSSPNLKKLTIGHFQCKDDDNTDLVLQLLEAQFCHSGHTFNRLREVRMESFTGAATELKFLELLLAKSLTLEKMYIELALQTKRLVSSKILKEVTQLERASPRAQIIYLKSWGCRSHRFPRSCFKSMDLSSARY